MKAFAEHLQQGESEQAQAVLDSAKSQLEPSVYWFNQGRLHAQDNNWPEARIAFLKSQKLEPRPETSANLDIVENKLVVSEVESPQTIKDYLIHSTYLVGSELALTLNLVLLVVGLVNFKRTKKIKSFASILVVMLMLSGLSLWTRHWPWTVAEEELPVFYGPSEIFEKVAVVPKGILILGTSKDSWIKVIYPSRFAGWIKKENISEL